MAKSIAVTTANNLEGYDIAEYLGVSASCVSRALRSEHMPMPAR